MIVILMQRVSMFGEVLDVNATLVFVIHGLINLRERAVSVIHVPIHTAIIVEHAVTTEMAHKCVRAMDSIMERNAKSMEKY